MHNEQQRLKYHGERVKSRRIHQSRSIRLENRPRHREEEENHGYVRNEGEKKHPADYNNRSGGARARDKLRREESPTSGVVDRLVNRVPAGRMRVIPDSP